MIFYAKAITGMNPWISIGRSTIKITSSNQTNITPLKNIFQN